MTRCPIVENATIVAIALSAEISAAQNTDGGVIAGEYGLNGRKRKAVSEDGRVYVFS
jgi:hypothetical protein